MRTRPAALAASLALCLAATGCGASAREAPPGSVAVVATTTVLGDLVRAVGGDRASVVQILQPNTDAHDYEPRPRDVLESAGAKLVVQSGDGLDRWMGDVVEQSGSDATVLDVSRRLGIRRPGERGGEEASTYDPHWWHDPRNTETAVGEIRDALVAANPPAAATYSRNARAYLAKVRALDAGIAACFARVPRAQRKLVTDHDAFGYFAARYGLRVIGAVIPSQTTQAQASAGDVDRLTKRIAAEGVKAVFPESSVNEKLARAIARQTGASVAATLYGDALGPAGSPGATYLGMERANADAMVRGFTGGKASCSIPGL